MLLWEHVHPYNAAHAIRLAGKADVSSLHSAIEGACRQAGIGNFALDRANGIYRYKPALSIALHCVPNGRPAGEALAKAITTELNAAFPDEPAHPIRWFILEDAASSSFFLIVVYRHVAADSFSIRLLLSMILNRYLFGCRVHDHCSLCIHSLDDPEEANRGASLFTYGCSAARVARRFLQMRHAYRWPEQKEAGNQVTCLFFDAPAGLLCRLKNACASLHVSINDAFVSALGATLATLTPARRQEPRRRGLALGYAVSLRDERAENIPSRFGLYLGHGTAFLQDPDDQPMETLLEEIRPQTQVMRTDRSILSIGMDYFPVVRLHNWLADKDSRAWYQKTYPLCGFLSSVTLERRWHESYEGAVLAYYRIAPPGVIAPFTLAPSLLGNVLTLTVCFRGSALTEMRAQQLATQFLSKLDDFSERHQAAPFLSVDHA
jgi:hypothetical protein